MIPQVGFVNTWATYRFHPEFQNPIHMPSYGIEGYYMPQPMPPPINQTIISNDVMRTLIQALGRGVGNPPNNPNARWDQNLSKKHSITISKLLTKFLVEGDPFLHIERFEQICDTYGEVGNFDMVNDFGLSLEGKARQLYRSLETKEKVNWTRLLRK